MSTQASARSVLVAAPPRVQALPCTLVLALILGLSRWGTNIGIGSLFISDVLIALALVNWLLTPRPGPKAAVAKVSDEPAVSPAPRVAVPLSLALFLAFVLIRLVTSLGSAPFLDTLRDGVPYVYALMAVIAIKSLATATLESRRRTITILTAALSIHVLWVAAAVAGRFTRGFAVDGIFQAPVLQVRPDIDAALCASAGGVYLFFLIRGCGRRRFWSAVGLGLVLLVVLSLGTRAGLISLAATLSVAFALSFVDEQRRLRRMVLALAVPLLIAGAVIVAPTTAPGERLAATLGAGVSTAAQQNAQGTTRARQLTWDRVVEWTRSDDQRFIVGAGFGPDILEQSGTLQWLEGTRYSNVRSPHNYFVGSFARLGLIGIVLMLGVLITVAFAAVRSRIRLASDPLLRLACLLVVAILPVATFGVVLEAPFGAIPFWWAVGALCTLLPPLGRSRQARATVAPPRSAVGGVGGRGEALSRARPKV